VKLLAVPVFVGVACWSHLSILVRGGGNVRILVSLTLAVVAALLIRHLVAEKARPFAAGLALSAALGCLAAIVQWMPLLPARGIVLALPYLVLWTCSVAVAWCAAYGVSQLLPETCR
jgi:hypothetical protein